MDTVGRRAIPLEVRYGRAAGQSYRSVGSNKPYIGHTAIDAMSLLVPEKMALEPSAAFALPTGGAPWSIMYVEDVLVDIAMLFGRAENTPSEAGDKNLVHHISLESGASEVRSRAGGSYTNGYASSGVWGAGTRVGLITYNSTNGLKFYRSDSGELANEANAGGSFGPLTTGMFVIGSDPNSSFYFRGQIFAITMCAADLSDPEYAAVREAAYQASRTRWSAE